MNRVGKYELLDLLGRGGCGEVWKARDTELGRIVALKLMQRTDEEDLARFKREAHVVAQLSHPNIAQLYEFSIEPAYLAMQYIEGGPLAPTTPHKVAAMRDAARAVHFAHGRGILHRDLKPANIMVDSAGRASVLDFGLAREVKGDQTAMTMSGDILGTPSYMAPEQARGDVKSLDVRTDVYGLGATLYFLLTGRPPHTGATAFDVISHVLKDEVSRPGGDRDLETICLQALEKEPSRRYASAEEFADDLDRYLHKEPIRARPASTLYRLKKRIQRQPVVWSLSSLLVVAIIGGSGFGLAMLVKRLQDRERAAAEAARRLEAEGLLEAARRTLNRLDIMQREPEADPMEPDIAKEALDWLAKVDSICPELAETHLERGRVFALMNREDDALAEFARAIEKAPRLAGARLERAMILSMRYESLRHEMEGPKRETPQMRELQANVRDDVRAVEAWSMDERNVELAKGLLAFGKGEYKEAVERLKGYLRRSPGDAAAWFRLGNSLYHLHLHPEAIDALTKALHQRPRFLPAYCNRGLARKEKGDFLSARGLLEEAMVEWDRAIEDYDQALKIDPYDCVVYNNRGDARVKKGDFERAIADFDEALKINPRYPEAYVDRGIAREAMGDLDGALADYAEALNINPRIAEAYFNRGNVRQKKGDFRGAITDYDEALMIDPRDAFSYHGIGNARLAMGDLGGAIAAFGEALKIDPRNASAYYNRGIARDHNGDHDGAIADYDEALKINPRKAEAYTNRGGAREAGGDIDGAIADYSKALEVAPTNWPYRKTVEAQLERLRQVKPEY